MSLTAHHGLALASAPSGIGDARESLWPPHDLEVSCSCIPAKEGGAMGTNSDWPVCAASMLRVRVAAAPGAPGGIA